MIGYDLLVLHVSDVCSRLDRAVCIAVVLDLILQRYPSRRMY